MPISSPRYPFTADMVAGAPPDPGVYSLWEGAELIYYGRAQGGESIQSRLREHLQDRRRCFARATHYGWEIAANPHMREAELLEEFRRIHGELPRCNRNPR